jgi:hypothetical protein
MSCSADWSIKVSFFIYIFYIFFIFFYIFPVLHACFSFYTRFSFFLTCLLFYFLHASSFCHAFLHASSVFHASSFLHVFRCGTKIPPTLFSYTPSYTPRLAYTPLMSCTPSGVAPRYRYADAYPPELIAWHKHRRRSRYQRIACRFRRRRYRLVCISLARGMHQFS